MDAAASSSAERLRELVLKLASYSNAKIVEIATGFVEMSKESPATEGNAHKLYVDSFEGAFARGESHRCLALLYVCNEILTTVPEDESWRAVLAKAMTTYLPLICGLALRQKVSFGSYPVPISSLCVCGCAFTLCCPLCFAPHVEHGEPGQGASA